MTILCDWQIEERLVAQGMLSPWALRTEEEARPSYGLGPAGYDVRLHDEFIEFNAQGDARRFRATEYRLDPGGFVLAATIERFVMPDDVVGMVRDKSTYARRGISVQNTVIEPGWRGILTLEINNHGPMPVHLHVGWGIAQVLFTQIQTPRLPYRGKYQNAMGVEPAR